MKKRIMFFALVFLLLSSCNSNITSDVSSIIDKPPITTSDVTSISNSLLDSSGESSIETNDWNTEIKNVFKTVLEDENLVPYIKADYYTFDVKQDQGIDFVDVLISGIHTETIIEDYTKILESNGYYVSQPSLDYLASKEVDVEDNCYIQFNLIEQSGTSSGNFLHLMAYRVQERTTIWPDDLLYTMYFETLPRFPAKSYEMSYYFDSTNVTYVLTCYAYYTEEKGYELYKDSLINSGFDILDNGDYYKATSETSNLDVMVYDYDNLNNLVYLKVTCNRLHFPDFMFKLLIEEEIPTIEVSGCEYDYFFFDNNEGLLNDYTQEPYVPVLYIYNLENEYYLDYLNRLIENGWKEDTDGTYKKTINGKEHTLFLVYSETYESMAIFVIK